MATRGGSGVAGAEGGMHVTLMAGHVSDPAMAEAADLSDALDMELPDGMTAPGSRRAHRRYWRELKGSEPSW